MREHEAPHRDPRPAGRATGAVAAEHDEVLQLVSGHKLHGKGLGWIDAHLLASALLAGCTLWTKDRALADAARRLKIDA